MLLDFPPWLQTLLTVIGCAALLSPLVGLVMLKRDPRSVLGRRLVLAGVWFRGLLASEPAIRAMLPLPMRGILASLPEVSPADLAKLEAAARESVRTGAPVVVAVVAAVDPEATPITPRGES